MHPSALRCLRIMAQSFLWRVCSMSKWTCSTVCVCEALCISVCVCQSTSETLWLGGIANLHLPLVTDWAPFGNISPPAPFSQRHRLLTVISTSSNNHTHTNRGHWEPNAPPICPFNQSPSYLLIQSSFRSHNVTHNRLFTQQAADCREKDLCPCALMVVTSEKRKLRGSGSRYHHSSSLLQCILGGHITLPYHHFTWSNANFKRIQLSQCKVCQLRLKINLLYQGSEWWNI